MDSPCIRMCALNEEDVCLGCGRMLNEITSWASYSDARRASLMADCKKRLFLLGKKTASMEKP
ncbi:MAG: DUF1289 domain-containing protein [Cycloclasticus sp.]|nr:DUF1289 domain-containing protein [Cycloclasticus sp.]MBG97222.1 DUF1289 domain-containing protein [Cycloclasticus sp.]HAI97472.1 DUF1289 domain-containing protein [Methylococcaceae bacterium]